MNNTDKPRVKFYNDGTFHREGASAVNFHGIFGLWPITNKQVVNVLDEFLRVNPVFEQAAINHVKEDIK